MFDSSFGQRLNSCLACLQQLLLDALEFQNLFHYEHGSSEEVKAGRIASVRQQIEATGTYELTFDEAQHGARVAWRNAPKCANRKFWDALNLLYFREVRLDAAARGRKSSLPGPA